MSGAALLHVLILDAAAWALLLDAQHTHILQWCCAKSTCVKQSLVGAQEPISLVPMKDRAPCTVQVAEEAAAVGVHCGLKATVCTAEGPQAVQATAVRTAGPIVVSTPGRVARTLKSGLLPTETLQQHLCALVLDEADMLLLHEYEEDLQAIAPQVGL